MELSKCELCKVGSREIQVSVREYNSDDETWDLSEQILMCHSCDENIQEILKKMNACRKPGETVIQLFNRLGVVS